jgi:hypothetical protein
MKKEPKDQGGIWNGRRRHRGVRGSVMLDGKGAESAKLQGEPSVTMSSLLALISLTFSAAV